MAMDPHTPTKLPLDSLDWMRAFPLASKATFELARYSGILEGMVNPDLLLSPMTYNEALFSSRIEGTQATLEEVLTYEVAPTKEAEKTGELREVVNYRRALGHAVEYLQSRPTCLNLCKEMHFILLDSVRGRNKARGEFRKSQNYVGKYGTTIEQASYVPPPPERLMEFLDNLEQYMHYEDKDRLVQLALIHAQFEIIHPFLDGNGRVGRILIPVWLVERGMLKAPVFYISEYLDRHRDEYYDRLEAITTNGLWDDWIGFFLSAVVAQSKANAQKARAVLDLYDEMKQRIGRVLKSQYSIRTLDTIFETPIFTAPVFAKRSNIPKASAIRILRTLRKEGIISLQREGSGRKPSLLAFGRVLEAVK
jgi:Fic family protein